MSSSFAPTEARALNALYKKRINSYIKIIIIITNTVEPVFSGTLLSGQLSKSRSGIFCNFKL